jgi:hypothetical protein
MTTKNHFAVYEHIRPDTGQVFYVGKGAPCRVRNHTRGHNRHHINILKKLTFFGLKIEVSIVADNLPEESANILEKMRIAMWRAAGVPLVNLTEGGEGLSNPSEETREKIGSHHKGNSYAKGYTHTEEARAKISAAHKGRVLGESARRNIGAAKVGNTFCLGRTHTQETRQKISDVTRGKKRTPEQCARISEANRGKKNHLGHKHSPEARAKMSAAVKAAILRKKMGVN